MPRGRVAPWVVAALVLLASGCSTGRGDPPAARAGNEVTTTTAARVGEHAAEATTAQGLAPRQPVRSPRGDAAARVVGYYAGWERAALAPAAIPTALVTHVNYAFATVTADSTCRLADPDERATIAELQSWKRRAGARTLLAIGGWEQSRHFSAAAATPEGRAALAASCVSLARELGFDGIDVDWEYPSTGKWGGRLADPANYVALLAVMRASMRAGELLTVATPASPGVLETFGLSAMEPYVDWFNVMAYDQAGPWDDRTGHNAPLVTAIGPFGAQAAVMSYELAGVAPAKLVLGVPFYGHVFANVDGIEGPSAGLGQPFGGTPASAPSGALTYRAIAPLVAQRAWQRHWDEVGLVPWLVNARDRQLISYDDPASMRAKAAFASEAGLGGVMVWELTNDDRSFTLLRSLNEALGRAAG